MCVHILSCLKDFTQFHWQFFSYCVPYKFSRFEWQAIFFVSVLWGFVNPVYTVPVTNNSKIRQSSWLSTPHPPKKNLTYMMHFVLQPAWLWTSGVLIKGEWCHVTIHRYNYDEKNKITCTSPSPSIITLGLLNTSIVKNLRNVFHSFIINITDTYKYCKSNYVKSRSFYGKTLGTFLQN